ncbi:hypothetical protein [Amycolatopsis sp. cmx-4-61]|uniref:hypothetical protein n=1 Tax=Amycolatopsis sp. cmx-4-61 TaxID=2790937 RepID=UPI0039792CC4
MAAVDTSVTRHSTRIRVLIDEHGKEAAVAAVHAWLLNQPPDTVAALAGLGTRLRRSRDDVDRGTEAH